jgi:hypothetical protein
MTATHCCVMTLRVKGNTFHVIFINCCMTSPHALYSNGPWTDTKKSTVLLAICVFWSLPRNVFTCHNIKGFIYDISEIIFFTFMLNIFSHFISLLISLHLQFYTLIFKECILLCNSTVYLYEFRFSVKHNNIQISSLTFLSA